MKRSMFFVLLGYIALAGQLYLIFQGEEKIYVYACVILAFICFSTSLWESHNEHRKI